MNLTSKIYVAGHRGMVGSAILKCLKNRGYNNLVYASSTEIDLHDPEAVNIFFFTRKTRICI